MRHMLEALEGRRLLSAGDLVTSFGTGGETKVGFRLFFEDRQPAIVASQSDGKILVAWQGATAVGPGEFIEEPPTFLARLLPSGALDTTFGGTSHGQPSGTPSGVVAFPTARVLTKLLQVLPQSNGKIFLVGQSQGGATQRDAAVVKLNSDGTLDTSFGGSGRGFTGAPGGAAFFDFGSTESEFGDFNNSDFAYTAAVSSAGKIAVGAHVLVNAGDQEGIALLLLKTDGTLDSGFASGGKNVFTYSTLSGGNTTQFDIETVTFDTSGNIITHVVKTQGFSEIAHQDVSHKFVKVSQTATPNLGGGVTPSFPKVTPEGSVHETIPLGDGSMLYTAESEFGSAIGKIKADLTIDSTFGDKGLAFLIPPNDDQFFLPERVAVLSDGRFYVGGLFIDQFDQPVHFVHIARFDANGILDGSFGTRIIGGKTGEGENTSEPFDLGTTAFALTTTTNDDVVPILTNRFQPNPQDILDEYVAIKLDGGAGVQLNAKGTLSVGGTRGDDTISLSIRASDGKLIVHAGNVVQGFSPSKIKRIRVYGYDGADTITIGAGVKGSYLNGGNGNDSITGGDGDDIIEANDGNDVLAGGGGADKIAGFAGNDSILGGPGNDQLSGDAGADTVSGAGGNDKLFGGIGVADSLFGGLGDDVGENDPLDTRSGIETLLA